MAEYTPQSVADTTWEVKEYTPASITNTTFELKDGVVQLLSPTDLATGQSKLPTFSWESYKPENSRRYQVLVSTLENDFSNALQYITPNTSFTIPEKDQLSGNTTYYWKVRPAVAILLSEYNETFDVADQSGWVSPWITETLTGTASQSIASNKAVLSTTGSGRSVARLGGVTFDNFDITLKNQSFADVSQSAQPTYHFRTQGDWRADNHITGYFLWLFGSQISIGRIPEESNPAVISSETFARTANVDYDIRLRGDQYRLRVYIWESGTTAPTDPIIDTTDSNATFISGGFGIKLASSVASQLAIGSVDMTFGEAVVGTEVTAFSIDQSDISLSSNSTSQLTTTTVGKNISGGATFISSDPSVVSVDSSGVVTWLSAGVVTITATSSDNISYTDTIQITAQVVGSYVAPGSQAIDTQWANDFYNATNGANWINNTGWNGGNVTLQVGSVTDAPYGLECAEINGEIRITKVDFYANNCVNGVAVGKDAFDGNIYDVVNEIPDRFDELYYCTYVNLKGNVLGGNFPQSLSRMPNVEKILIQGRADTATTDGYKDPSPQAFNHYGKRRQKTENFFSGAFPFDWSECQNLMDLECSSISRSITLTGTLPPSLWLLPKIRIVLLEGNRELSGPIGEVANPATSLLANVALGVPGSSAYGGKSLINGPLPSNWGSCPDLHFMTISNTDMTGPFPQEWKDNLRNVRVFEFPANAGLVDTFPTFMINGNHPYLFYFRINDTGIYGELPDTIDVNPSPHISKFNIDRLNITGELKNWVANIRHIQFRVVGTNITSLGSEFYNPNAAIWNRLRFWDVSYNKISGQELPDVIFTPVDFSGTVQSQNGLEIGISTNLGLIYTGTVTQTTGTGGDWYRDINAGQSGSNPWPNSWNGYEITLVDPDGLEPNRRYIHTSSTNWEFGYLYPRGNIDLNTGLALDIGGIVGWTYEIRPLVLNKVIRFKRGNNDYIPRKILSKTDSTITMDRTVPENVVGMEYDIHDFSAKSGGANASFIELQTRGNDWVGKIPESYAYIPTDRTMSWIQLGRSTNTGVVPDFTNIGYGGIGDANRVYIQDSKFLPRDLLPNLANNSTLNTFDYSNQKPFSDPQEITVVIGQNLLFDDFSPLFSEDYANYTFSWRKDGVEVQTTDVLELTNIQSSDLGLYRLVVTHSALTGEWTSGDINIKE